MIRFFKIPVMNHKILGARANEASIPVTLPNHRAKATIPANRVGKNRASTTPIRIVFSGCLLAVALLPLIGIWTCKAFTHVPAALAADGAETIVLQADERSGTPFTRLFTLRGAAMLKAWIPGTALPTASDGGTARADLMHACSSPFVIATLGAKIVRGDSGSAMALDRNPASIASKVDHQSMISGNPVPLNRPEVL